MNNQCAICKTRTNVICVKCHMVICSDHYTRHKSVHGWYKKLSDTFFLKITSIMGFLIIITSRDRSVNVMIEMPRMSE
jgi:hypothetical protein